MKANVTVGVGLHVAIIKDKRKTIMYSPALKLYGYGNNEREAKASLRRCLKKFFRLYDSEAKFHKKLKSLGWVSAASSVKPPVDRSIPIELLGRSKEHAIKNIPVTMPYAIA